MGELAQDGPEGLRGGGVQSRDPQEQGHGFSQFGRFAAATAEWRVLDGNFPGADANQPDEAQFPDVQRRESCVRAARRTGSASTTRRSGSFESSRARPTSWSCG